MFSGELGDDQLGVKVVEISITKIGHVLHAPSGDAGAEKVLLTVAVGLSKGDSCIASAGCDNWSHKPTFEAVEIQGELIEFSDVGGLALKVEFIG